MPSVIIFYNQFMNKDHSYSIGGIQTYIQLLIKALEHQYKIVVVQCSTEKFSYENDKFKVISVAHTNKKNAIRFIESELLTQPTDILLFASEQFACNTKWKNTLVIQHGVYWDLPVNIYKPKMKNMFLSKIYKLYDNYRNFKRIKDFKHVVCVDNNYINWFRTLTDKNSDVKFYPILNCAGEDFFRLKEEKKSKEINILFARRFVVLRGVELFAEVAYKLINKYDNVNIVIVGDGPKKEWLVDKLGQSDRIFFKSATYDEMPEIMNESDIVVVPSLGSEGTSLSAIEAMAAGKAVVATNVGGLTNIIIHGFNGLLSNISIENVFENISLLIDDNNYRKKVSANAKLVAEQSLHFDQWSKSWKNVLIKITQENENKIEDV